MKKNPYGPARFVTYLMSFLLLGLVSGCAAIHSSPASLSITKVDDGHPAYFQVMTNGKKAGGLVLGKTTAAETERLLQNAGAGLVAARDNASWVVIGGITVTPRSIYKPSTYRLYFDSRNILVLIIDAAPRDVSRTGQDFRKKFSGSVETSKNDEQYEVQAPLSKCVWLIGVYRVTDDSLDSAGYGYSCVTE